MFIVMMSYLLASCSDEGDKPIGKWDDNIKLSTKKVDFKAQTDSVTIKTEGDWWWINGITFADSTYWYYNRKDINMESTSYSIKENDFLIERRDKKTLFVKINENTTGAVRKMGIKFEAGNYFDYVNIIQSGK